MIREEFTRELQNIIRDSRIRQNIIAQALNLSPAALSQFVHGIALPSRSQLLSLLDLLCVPPYQTESMCAKLNAAKRELSAEMPQPPVEIQEDFDNNDDIPLNNVSDNDNDGDIGDDTPKRDNSDWSRLDRLYRQQKFDDGVLFMESPVKAIPVIYLDEFADFRPEKISFEEFTSARLHDTIIRDYGSIQSPVMIKTIGTRLGLAYEGMIHLVASPTLPGNMTELYLVGFPNGVFRIQPRNSNGLEQLFPFVNPANHPLWKLAIVEFTITPLGVASYEPGEFL